MATQSLLLLFDSHDFIMNELVQNYVWVPVHTSLELPFCLIPCGETAYSIPLLWMAFTTMYTIQMYIVAVIWCHLCTAVKQADGLSDRHPGPYSRHY